ncbi:MAG TPA: transcription-repair coupling factor, partial [bacterium]|nr:transcription-repair coupling factor [bacterium]
MIEQIAPLYAQKSGTPGADSRLQLVGLKGAAKALAVAEWLVREKRPALVVLPTERDAEAFHRDLAFFLGVEDTDAPAAPGRDADLVRFAADDFKPYEAASPDPDDAAGRVEALYRLAHFERPVAVVTSARGLARRTIPREALEHAVELVQQGEEIDRERFLAHLSAAGYARVSVVEDRGTFAVRGAIVDLWPPLHPKPVRLEFFGDEIESIRRFDVGSQRSKEPFEELVVLPVREVFFGGREAAAAKRALEPKASQGAGDALAAIERKFAFSGIEALIPWIYAADDGSLRLETALDYVPPRAAVFRVDPMGIERELAALASEAMVEHARAMEDHRVVPAPEILFADHATLFP